MNIYALLGSQVAYAALFTQATSHAELVRTTRPELGLEPQQDGTYAHALLQRCHCIIENRDGGQVL